jgi:glycosyltransferase involved in cell wall biosynthesis
MKILILSPSFPFPHSGTQVRVFNIIRNLARHHEITLISLIAESELEHVPLLEPFCKRIELISKPQLGRMERLRSLFQEKGKWANQARRLLRVLQGVPVDIAGKYLDEYKAKVDSLLQQDAYDIIKMETLFMEQYLDRNLLQGTKAKTVLVEIDIASVRVYREYLQARAPLKQVKLLQYRMLRRYEESAWHRVDRVVAVSELDKKRILGTDPSLKVWVIPNPVDTGFYHPPLQRRSGKALLFVGGLDFGANYDGILFFLREVFPLILRDAPEAALTVVGRCSPGQRKVLEAFPRVSLAGFVEDIRPFLNKASVFVVPLRIGGGTRVKILTAMAAGLPVVSTTLGCEGIELNPEEEILLADRPEEFARQTLRLFEDQGLREALQLSGRRLMERKYAWDVLDLGPVIRGNMEEEGSA